MDSVEAGIVSQIQGEWFLPKRNKDFIKLWIVVKDSFGNS